MIDLKQYDDDTVLTTREVAAWLEVGVDHVLSLPIEPLPWRTRERRYRAGDVKRAILGEQERRERRGSRRGNLQLRTASR